MQTREDAMGAARTNATPFAGLRRVAGGELGRARIAGGFAVALIAGPLLTWLLFALRSPESITVEVLAYQLLVVIVALVGGALPAVFAAVLSGLTIDLLFVAPQYSVTIEHPLHLIALGLYVVTALLVSFVVAEAARRARAAQQAAEEAELLASVAGHVLRGDSAALALVSRARDVFGLSGVRLLDADGTVIARDGEPLRASAPRLLPVGRGADGKPRATLELHGGRLDAHEQRLLDAIIAQLGAVIEHTDLTATAREVEALAETDQVRSALLSALSHDLRRPLASAVAAIGGLRGADSLSDADRAELLATADESLATLTALVTDLLDASRVQAGVLAVSATPVDAADSVIAALDELSMGPADAELDLDPRLAPLHADPVLLQRVLVNLLANAFRYSPEDSRVTITARRRAGRGEIRIIDHGPGVEAARRTDMFQPFQRHGDVDNTTGLGLGLALSRGFTEGMGGTLTPEDTPGGGLTMIVSLPLSAPAGAATA